MVVDVKEKRISEITVTELWPNLLLKMQSDFTRAVDGIAT